MHVFHLDRIPEDIILLSFNPPNTPGLNLIPGSDLNLNMKENKGEDNVIELISHSLYSLAGLSPTSYSPAIWLTTHSH